MRWERAIIQQNGAVDSFLGNFLAQSGRHCALIAGAGFDPRTLALPRRLRAHPALDVRMLCLREERLMPQPGLRPIADAHAAELQHMFAGACTVTPVEIFDSGGGVVGGRRVVPLVDEYLNAAETKQPLTDILVDISALSCGIFFPIIAQLLEKIRVEKRRWNLHLFVAENPRIDIRIRGEIMDTVSHIHGYLSKDSLSQTGDHAILWAPVFSENNATQMSRIYDLINQPPAAVDILPIIPFPGLNPRRPDELVEHYRELIGDWQIDPRHFLYAAESDPLDSYRSICEIDQLRADTYRKLGGSSTVLSPLGSKMLSVGLMLAAIERTLRVVYVESLGYEELAVPVPSAAPAPALPVTHVWLAGEIYGGLV
jgi:hypothetical protein